jgi:hypothetical protein
MFDSGGDWTHLCTVGDRASTYWTLRILPRPAALHRLGRAATAATLVGRGQPPPQPMSTRRGVTAPATWFAGVRSRTLRYAPARLALMGSSYLLLKKGR